MGFDAGHQGGAFGVGERFRGVESSGDPGVVGVEGGVVGQGDMFVGSSLGGVACGTLLGAGHGEGTEGAEVPGVIGESAVLEDLLGDGDLFGLSVHWRDQREATECGESEGRVAGANYAGSGDVVPSATGLAGGPPVRNMRNSMSKPSWRTRS